MNLRDNRDQNRFWVPRNRGCMVPGTFVEKASAIPSRDGVVPYKAPTRSRSALKHEMASCEAEPGSTTPSSTTVHGLREHRPHHPRPLLREHSDEIGQFATHVPGRVAKVCDQDQVRRREEAPGDSQETQDRRGPGSRVRAAPSASDQTLWRCCSGSGWSRVSGASWFLAAWSRFLDVVGPFLGRCVDGGCMDSVSTAGRLS